MKVDGKAIAEELYRHLAQELENISPSPTLGLLSVGENPVTASYLSIKRRMAQRLGIRVVHCPLPSSASLGETLQALQGLSDCDGVVVQLPLPEGIEKKAVLDALPPSQDIDLLGSAAVESFAKGEVSLLPPVAGAIEEILSWHQINLEGKKVVILGRGALVGRPVQILLEHKGVAPTILSSKTLDPQALKEADIIISGAGVPGLIRPEMVKEGVILLDAGTSESSGKIAGDIAPECEAKASLFTPVPGGVGPITVAVLMRNLVWAYKKRRAKI